MRSAPGGGRSPARHALGPAGEQSPPAPQTASTVPRAASPMMQTPLVACRPPPGTNVSPRRATLRQRIPHLHSTVPARSPPRTAGDPHAAPQGAGLAIEEHPALTDPNAASASSSQPPSSGCCDDHLNPPWAPRSEWWMRPRGGARCWIAIISAFSHKELLGWSAMLQPTISRVAMSLTAAR
jgi:hypothetical protein